MVRCEFNEETWQMDVEAQGDYAMVELMFLMQSVAQEIGKITETDWKVQLYNMVQVVLGDGMVAEDIQQVVDATMNNVKYGATDPE